MRMLRSRRAAGVAFATAAVCLSTMAPLAAPASAADNNDGRLQYQRGQAFVSLEPASTGTFDAACPEGFMAVNGGFQMDGGSASASRDLFITSSNENTAIVTDDGPRNGWSVTLSNQSTETITGRVNAVCLGETTEGPHDHVVTKTLVESAGAATPADGIVEDEETCLAGQIPVGAGFVLTGPAMQVASIRDGLDWKLIFEDYSPLGDTTLTMTVYCLDGLSDKDAVSPSHQINIAEVRPDPDVVATDKIANLASQEVNFHCPAGSLALGGEFYSLDGAAAVAVDSGVIPLGGEPRSQITSQRFYNDSGDKTDVVVDGVCIQGAKYSQIVDVTYTGKTAHQVSFTVSCNAACGTLTGKLYSKTLAGKMDTQVAFGRVALGSQRNGTLKIRIKRNKTVDAGSYFLVVDGGGGFSKRYSVTIP